MKVAVVHYWLVGMRGGEKMLEALLELFPDADIYTHVYDSSAVSEAIKKHRVFTTYINKLPFAKKLYRKYMPLMPRALQDLNLQDYDLIISSEAGPAKGVVPRPDAFHLCYCHSPMRYLWDMYGEYFESAGPFTKFFMKRLVPGLRLWDIASSNLVDKFITNSSYSAQRIRRYYRREAEIVWGPADIEKFASRERSPSGFYLCLGEITPYKRIDIAAQACEMLGRKLVVAGGAKNCHVKDNSATTEYLGRVSGEAAADLYSRARALLFPGIEDMGLVPVEAQAAGCPVIAFKRGGVLDTMLDGKTGIFFEEQTPRSLADAILRFEAVEGVFSNRAVFTEHIKKFSTEAFKKRVKKIIDEAAAP